MKMNFFTIKGHLSLTMPIKCDKCVYGQVSPEWFIPEWFIHDKRVTNLKKPDWSRHYCEDCFDKTVLQINAIAPHYFQKCSGCGKVRDLKITLEGAFCDACLAKQGA